jgi:hypothetical protein
MFSTLLKESCKNIFFKNTIWKSSKVFQSTCPLTLIFNKAQGEKNTLTLVSTITYFKEFSLLNFGGNPEAEPHIIYAALQR